MDIWNIALSTSQISNVFKQLDTLRNCHRYYNGWCLEWASGDLLAAIGHNLIASEALFRFIKIAPEGIYLMTVKDWYQDGQRKKYHGVLCSLVKEVIHS
jgi:hypothetical protein